MRRVALGLALVLVLASPGAYADPAPSPPPWMPAPRRPPTRDDEDQIKHLKHEATAFGTVGIVLLAGGIAVDVVARDVPQGEQATRQPDGNVVTERVRNDANWAELAAGLALTATGLALVSIAYLRIKQMRKLQATE